MSLPNHTISHPLGSMPTVGGSWVEALYTDLAVTPGRLKGALRIVLASAIALILMEALQMPFISTGMYFIFLIGRDSPAVSLRSSFLSLITVIAAIAFELGIVALTDNDPTARLLSVAVVAFISALLVVASNNPPLGSTFGLIFCTVIALWETHAPANTIVKTSLYMVGTFAISLSSAVAVEYLFGSRAPTARLREERRARWSALEAMFRAYGENAAVEKRMRLAAVVSRLAVNGQTGMIGLYETIVERNLDTSDLPPGMRVRITMLAELMDISAAFGLLAPNDVDDETRTRCIRLADICLKLKPAVASLEISPLPLEAYNEQGVLDRIELTLQNIVSMPQGLEHAKQNELVTVPIRKVPFFIPGALRNPENVAFGLKLGLCAIVCYILVHALDWPYTSTSVTTVIVTGLSSSAAIKQRLIFRMLGSIIGGLILGLGATVFFFPHMDSISSLLVLQCFVAFVAAWIAGGPKFNYVGLQIAFSFYVVAYDGLRAPTQLAPARDRSIGIAIALGLMWLVFDQFWPVRTTTIMRRSFASVLRINADLLRTIDSPDDTKVIMAHVDVLRDQVGKTIANLRTLNGAVPFEIGSNRQEHVQAGNLLLGATLTTASIFWQQLALLHGAKDTPYLRDAPLRSLRADIANQLDVLADAIREHRPTEKLQLGSFRAPALLADRRYDEYVRNAESRYLELQGLTSTLSLLV